MFDCLSTNHKSKKFTNKKALYKNVKKNKNSNTYPKTYFLLNSNPRLKKLSALLFDY